MADLSYGIWRVHDFSSIVPAIKVWKSEIILLSWFALTLRWTQESRHSEGNNQYKFSQPHKIILMVQWSLIN